MAVTVQELINNPKYQDQKCLVLLNKPTVDGSKRRRRPRNQKPPKYFVEFANEVREFMKKQTQFNEFVIQQFKLHGWIK